MKRIKSVNGYTIYLANDRDAQRYNVTADYYYLYFSSDIREYGLSNSEWDWEAGSLKEALEWATGTNYATAREIVEENTTAATAEEIGEIEMLLDSGMTRDEIDDALENDALHYAHVYPNGGVYYVRVVDENGEYLHGPYLTKNGADNGARNYARNTGAKYCPID